MANRYLKKTTVYVEGRDDLYSIATLLEKHALQMVDQPRDVEIHPAALDDKGFGREKLLGLVGTAVKASTEKAVGFVIDADDSAAATWDSIRDRIEKAVGTNAKAPRKFPLGGWVKDVASLQSRVGVWIMPDNSSAGILEDFLEHLISKDDKVISIAKSAIKDAKAAGAAFKTVAESKAVLHAWLAWQAEPGCPFGTAIKSHYFDHNASSAQAFVRWVQRLID